MVAAQRHAQERRERAREERQAAAAALVEGEEAAAAETEEAASECDPNYAGACLDPYAYDYDCEGGEGDGPEYTGTVTVVGEDHYELNADPESDSFGCDP